MTAHHPQRLEVYLDLDGVFADFEGRVRRLSGKHPDQLPPARMWKLINSDPRFFADLELIEGCMALWEATRDLEPIFLTGAPSSRVFQEQKREWVARVFGPEYTVHVVPRRRKRDFAAPHRILIDDTPDNIAAWVEAGGQGILHRHDHASTIAALRRLLEMHEEQQALQTADS